MGGVALTFIGSLLYWKLMIHVDDCFVKIMTNLGWFK